MKKTSKKAKQEASSINETLRTVGELLNTLLARHGMSSVLFVGNGYVQTMKVTTEKGRKDIKKLILSGFTSALRDELAKNGMV